MALPVRIKGSKFGGKVKKSGSLLRTFVEVVLFISWLGFTGIGGYFLGQSQVTRICPPTPVQDEITVEALAVRPKCIPNKDSDSRGVGTSIGATYRDGGYTFDEIKTMWKCSQAISNYSQASDRIFPADNKMDQTKWKSIISVEPKAFFDKYLSQYPGDTRAIQPVIVFSHKPLQDASAIDEVCKVIDIAIVPDAPGVCVAVTETFHDVASYHMLHADKQTDGTFAITANSLEGRTLPDEAAYASGRALLLQYFDNVDYVTAQVKAAPKFGGTKVSVGSIIEDIEEMELFKNSVVSASKVGVNKSKFCVFTTSSAVNLGLKSFGVKIIYLSKLSDVGRVGASDVGAKYRRYFLQAWLAFAVANSGNKMLWQSPGTIWLDRPDNIVSSAPIVETLWSFKGRKDRRAGPFFSSFDFFCASYAERPVHLMHEILLHFDLVLAWESLDSVASYRLLENNSRYGTTTFSLPPFKVLHTDLIGADADKLKAAVRSPDKPMAIVVAHEGLSPSVAKQMLMDAGLWYI